MKTINKPVISGLVILMLFSAFIINNGTKKVENFKLKDYNGKEYQLSGFKESKAIVIMFVSTQCPVSNGYNERMAKLYSDYKDKNITFLAINSNKEESIAEIKKHAQDHNFKFPVLKDVNNVIADKFEAGFTPEIFMLNNNLEIVYHGRIDDSRRESDIKTNDLRNALDEVLAGKTVSVAETKAFGCSIKRINND